MENRVAVFFALIFILGACRSQSGNRPELQFTDKNRTVPSFNADSAYSFIVDQVQAGPRNPNAEGHKKTRQYLLDKLKAYAGDRYVFTQNFTHRGYQSDTLQLSNIIAAFNPSSSDRIMLCAHWDTRPRADQDTVDTEMPIAGADDGGSGVAVLLELARLFKTNMPPIGVDIVLFDGEDYGREGQTDQYFLGSRYWSNHPPVENYQPRFAILLDMVGGENARFLKEGFSRQFAPGLVREIWAIAGQKNMNTYFRNEPGARISDDHVVLNQIRNIPSVDIIHHTVNENGGAEFPPYWHTHRDNLEIISKKTLGAVGGVLAELVYNRL